MNASEVRIWTRRAQVGGITLVVCAVAAAAVPARWVGVSTANTEAPIQRPPAIKKTIDPLPEASATEIALALDKTAPEMPRENPPEEKTEEVAAAPPPPPPWRYIGAILLSTSRRAIVSAGDKQTMVRVGDKYEQAEVVEIEPEYMIVRENGEERQIDLAPNSHEHIESVKMATINGGAPVIAPNNSGFVPPGGAANGGAAPVNPPGTIAHARPTQHLANGADRGKLNPDGTNNVALSPGMVGSGAVQSGGSTTPTSGPPQKGRTPPKAPGGRGGTTGGAVE